MINTIEQDLIDWGIWKRYAITNMGFPSMGLEAQISSGQIMGNGCINGGSKLPEVHWKDNHVAMRIDACYIRLLPKHPLEMQILSKRYVLGWSISRIAKIGSVSRHNIRQLNNRGSVLIEGAL